MTTDILYTYTHYYGNGDYFAGSGIADSIDNYYTGLTIDSGYNETGNYGYFYIDSVFDYGVDYGLADEVYVTSYYDWDTGYGLAYSTTTDDPYYGLLNTTAPYGYAYNSNYSNSDNFFSTYYEADLPVTNTDVYYTYTYYYDNGDYFTGSGIADSNDNYYTGLTIDSGYNETGNYGYFYISSVFDYGVDYGLADEVYITSYYDGDASYSDAYDITTYGPYYGLLNTTAPYGYAYNSNYSNIDNFFSTYYEADLPVTNTDVIYDYTYYYGNGDYFTGSGIADSSDNYYTGLTIDSGYNETGNYGYFYIDSVFDYGVDYGLADEVSVYSYYDADTGYGSVNDINSDNPHYGLLDTAFLDGYASSSSSSGNVVVVTNDGVTSTDSYFSTYYEADLADLGSTQRVVVVT